ncbi:MAG: toll/interleukin-1 receptor domain-containing protein [Proteobacteria bacterium]|nr:toll/interleukin-1 receptor domain-containing protein [Pseudomonadota bacterium]
MKQFIIENITDIKHTVFGLCAYLIIALIWVTNPFSIMTGALNLPLDRQLTWKGENEHFVEEAATQETGVVTLVKNGSPKNEIVSYAVKGFQVDNIFANDEVKHTPLLARKDTNGSKLLNAINVDTVSLNGQEQITLVSVGHSPINQAESKITGENGEINGASVLSTGEIIVSSILCLFFGLLAGRPIIPFVRLIISARNHIFKQDNVNIVDSNRTRRTKVSKKHVFISYCHDDTSEVVKLRQDLINAGESIWWDQDIKGGQDWKHEIRKAMREAYAVVLCLSKKSMARDTSGIFPEAYDAIEAFREYSPGNIFLIPVRLSDCDIPLIEIDATRTLDRLQYIDLFPTSKRQEGFNKLTSSISSSSYHP